MEEKGVGAVTVQFHHQQQQAVTRNKRSTRSKIVTFRNFALWPAGPSGAHFVSLFPETVISVSFSVFLLLFPN
jgi:hypothetical protein